MLYAMIAQDKPDSGRHTAPAVRPVHLDHLKAWATSSVLAGALLDEPAIRRKARSW